jgi:hypothetical protein
MGNPVEARAFNFEAPIVSPLVADDPLASRQGTLRDYQKPLEPVGDADWEAAQDDVPDS